MLQQNYKHDTLTIWKRLGIFVVDIAISFVTYLIVFVTAGTFLINSVCEENINIANQEYIKVCEELNLPYIQENQYGLYQIDFDTYMDNKVEAGMDSEKAYEKYNEDETNLYNKLKENEKYTKAYSSFYLTYMFVAILSMAASLFVFQFIIPITTKKHQTIGMKIFKGAPVNNKTGVVISKMHVMLRFLIIFVTEFVCVYIILDWFGLIFLILITLFLISMTKTKSTFHDLILKCQVKKEEYAYTK